MSDKTGIEWCDSTWNPTTGCSLVSPGCTNCYAMKMAHRWRFVPGHKFNGLTQDSKAGAVWNGTVRLDEKALDQPLRWKKPRRIFVNSMSDLFHESLPDAAIDKVFAVMALAPQHTFQVLTKRAERMREYLAGIEADQALRLNRFGITALWTGLHGPAGSMPSWPLPNVWLGVSVEDQERADERIPHLLATPTAVRFLSCEPLLGPVDLTNLDGPARQHGAHGWSCIWKDNAIGRPWIDWVICGGESGPGARPMQMEWAGAIINQCRAAGVPCFVKQMGAKPTRLGHAAGFADRKGGDIEEWPPGYRVREFPCR